MPSWIDGTLYPDTDVPDSVETLDEKPMKSNTKADILNPYFLVIGAADRDWLSLLPDSE